MKTITALLFLAMLCGGCGEPEVECVENDGYLFCDDGTIVRKDSCMGIKNNTDTFYTPCYSFMDSNDWRLDVEFRKHPERFISLDIDSLTIGEEIEWTRQGDSVTIQIKGGSK